jgi:hypothetical protein
VPPQIAAPPPAPIARVERTENAPVAPGETRASSPVPKRSRAKGIAFVLLSVIVLVGGGLAYRRGTARSPQVERAAAPSSAEEPASAEAPTSTAVPVPPPTFTAETPPSASAAKKPAAGAGAGAGSAAAAAPSADPSKTGIIDTTPLPAGRTIVVDGRMLGTSPRRFVVRCGVHRFQIGDLPPETLELPCGGEITFSD